LGVTKGAEWPTKGEQLQVRRDAMNPRRGLVSYYWLCALSDKLIERRPAPLLLVDSIWRYGEPSMLIPSARLGEGKWGEMLTAPMAISLTFS
jgi:hypothetical protein